MELRRCTNDERIKMEKITKKAVKQLPETAGDLDDYVYPLQFTKYAYILDKGNWDFDEITYVIQDL